MPTIPVIGTPPHVISVTGCNAFMRARDGVLLNLLYGWDQFAGVNV